MFVCLSVTGLQLKYTGLCIIYVPFGTCWLTRKRIGEGQHGVVSPTLQASPFQSFDVLRMRHQMRMCIPSIKLYKS